MKYSNNEPLILSRKKLYQLALFINARKLPSHNFYEFDADLMTFVGFQMKALNYNRYDKEIIIKSYNSIGFTVSQIVKVTFYNEVFQDTIFLYF